MPNHVTNEVTFSGDENSIKLLLVAVKSKNKVDLFSINSFYPMPIKLEGTCSPAKIITEAEMKVWKDKLAKGELNQWEQDYHPITLKMQRDYIKRFGTDNWYNWKVQNWGTKWDVYDVSEIEGGFSFDTAWATPYNALVRLSTLFPDVEINVRYADEDFGSNVGTYKLVSGLTIEEYAPEFGIESLRLAGDIKGDYYFKEGLSFVDEENINEHTTNCIRIAHENGYLIDDYPMAVLGLLFDMAVDDEQYERAKEIKNLQKKTLDKLVDN